MSPYLFVLAMEYLNRSLRTLIQNPDFNFHPKCARLQVLHICFADDLLMCCRADETSMKLMMEAFENFSAVSGLKANLDKSSLYIAGVPLEFKEKMIAELHLTLGTLPFKYLGVPLSTGKLTIHQCMPLVEKIVDRIRSWTSKFLSYAGRLQLIKSVLFEMKTYWAHVFLIPKKVIKIVNSICRSYLWSGVHDSNRAPASWETLCKPKAVGGLNIINYELWNKAALTKLLWAIMVNYGLSGFIVTT